VGKINENIKSILEPYLNLFNIKRKRTRMKGAVANDFTIVRVFSLIG
jgi:hypothetical protein